MSERTTSGQLTLSLVVSLVRTSAQQGKVPESSKATGPDFGLSLPESFANYDPDTSLWRTSQLSLLGGLALYSETWPICGTMRNGAAYLRPPWVRHTFASGFLSLLPTPTTKDADDPITGGDLYQTACGIVRARTKSGTSQRSLSDTVRWPTPTVQDSANNGGPSQQTRNTPPLNSVVGGALNPTWVEWLMGFPLGWTDLGD